MFEVIFVACIVALVLLVWFHSEAFLEYAAMVGGSRFFLIDDFRKKQAEAVYPAAHMDYVQYLQAYHNSFFTRLLSCPLCFSVWVTLITCFFSEAFIVFPISNVLGLIIYRLTSKVLYEW
jgi:hypothetical protein